MASELSFSLVEVFPPKEGTLSTYFTYLDPGAYLVLETHLLLGFFFSITTLNSKNSFERRI